MKKSNLDFSFLVFDYRCEKTGIKKKEIGTFLENNVFENEECAQRAEKQALKRKVFHWSK